MDNPVMEQIRNQVIDKLMKEFGSCSIGNSEKVAILTAFKHGKTFTIKITETE